MLSSSKYQARAWPFKVFSQQKEHICSILHHEGLVEALQAAKAADQQGQLVSRDIIYELLQRCFTKKDLALGRYVRCLMVSNGLDFIAPLGDHLIRTFTLCGSLLDADEVFLKVLKPSTFTWNAIIAAHINLGERKKAMHLFVNMQQDGNQPDKVTFLHLLKCCGTTQELGLGRCLHNHIIFSDVTYDAAIGNSIIDMYAKCGSLEDARVVFESMPALDSITWGVMIVGYVTHGSFLPALELLCKMPKKEIFSSRVVLSCSLKACGSMKLLNMGRLIHDGMEKSGVVADVLIVSALLNMYSLFGLIDEAQKLFDKVEDKSVHLWGEMIAGYAEQGFCDKALQVFENMQHRGLKPDKFSCLRILKACGSLGAMRQSRLMYDHAIRCGLDSDTMVGNTLIDIFAKCGSLEEAQKVFLVIKNPDVVSWSVIIAGYAQQGDGHRALELFKEMQAKGFVPSKVSYLGALKACGSLKDFDQGRKIHDQIAKTELIVDLLVGSTLIDMYAKCGSLSEAREVFDCLPKRNVVVWGAMIAGYAQHGLGVQALELYTNMKREDISPDKVLFSSVLQGCASVRDLNSGRLLHDHIIRDGFESHMIVGNTLIDLYVKCGSIEEARTVFDRLATRDIVSWGTMIVGYAQHNFDLAALELFESSQERGMKLNKVILLGLLKACGSLRAVSQGQIVHHYVLKEGLESDLVVCNTLLDMYSKFGNLKEAHRVFDRMLFKDEVSWSALIAGYAWCTEWDQVRKCLEAMKQHDMKPDDVTFTNILTACTHCGLLEEGHWFFRCMIENYGIVPSIEHYNCLVDLLSRNGCLYTAEDLVKSIPLSPDDIIWVALLTSCKEHGNRDIGTDCFDQCFEMDPSETSGCMLMASLYTSANMHVDSACKALPEKVNELLLVTSS
ncbi:hypothetical protein L7F22_015262 [Adiantum nelumboides]|nr:hypothetical protein [Adiantum nelumboides]